MKAFTLLTMLLSTSLAYANRESGGRDRNITVRVQFNEYGKGIAQNQMTEIFSRAGTEVAEQNVTEFKMREWGVKGEATLCLDFKSNAHAAVAQRAFDGIAAKAHSTNRFPLIDVTTVLSCQDLTLNPTEYRGTSTEELLIGTWKRSGERDGSEGTVYRHEIYELPPSRGREAMTFKQNGTFIKYTIGANDVPVAHPGTWKVVAGLTVQVSADGQAYNLEIASIGDTRLVIQP